MLVTFRKVSRVWLAVTIVTLGLVAGAVDSATAIQGFRLLDIVHYNGDGTLTCAKWCDLLGPCC